MAIAANELKRLVLKLPDRQRVELIASLLASLPSVLIDEDAGVAEALRRDAELEEGSQKALSLAALDKKVRQRRS